MSTTSKPTSQLRKISSLSQLKRERARLEAEQKFAIRAIGNNFTLEKAAMKHKFASTQHQVAQGITTGVDQASSVFDSLKWPALGGLAAIIGFFITSWLTGGDEETEEVQENQDQEEGREPIQGNDQRASAFSTSEADDEEPEQSLEERIKTALAEYENEKNSKGKNSGDNDGPSSFTTVLRIIGPIFLKEVLQGRLLEDIGLFGKKTEKHTQDMSDSIADQLETMKEELVE